MQKTPNVQELLCSWTYVLKHGGKNTNQSAQCLEQFKYSNGCWCTVLPAVFWGLDANKTPRLRATDLKLMISKQRMISLC